MLIMYKDWRKYKKNINKCLQFVFILLYYVYRKNKRHKIMLKGD